METYLILKTNWWRAYDEGPAAKTWSPRKHSPFTAMSPELASLFCMIPKKMNCLKSIQKELFVEDLTPETNALTQELTRLGTITLEVFDLPRSLSGVANCLASPFLIFLTKIISFEVHCIDRWKLAKPLLFDLHKSDSMRNSSKDNVYERVVWEVKQNIWKTKWYFLQQSNSHQHVGSIPKLYSMIHMKMISLHDSFLGLFDSFDKVEN